MSKANGFPLSKKRKTQSLKEKSKIPSQLGSITWQLSQLRFEKIGSPFEENGHLQVRSCLSQGLVVSERDTLEELPRGPFASEKEYLDALISALLLHGECLPLSHHCFFAQCPTRSEYDDGDEYLRAYDLRSNFVTFGSIDRSDNRVDYTIAGDCLREIASEWVEELEMSDPYRNIGPRRFCLYHPDLNVNNIFDDDCQITCIIDWTFCSSVPLSVLFMPAGLPQSRDKLEAPLIAAFEDGLSNAIPAEQEYLHESRASPRSDFVWLFYRLASFDSTGDFHLFNETWQMSNRNNLDLSTFFKLKQSSDYYLRLHEEMGQEDEPPDRVMQQAADYSRKDVVGVTASKKLTLVSEWTSRYRKHNSKSIRRNASIFVADDRLWRWVSKSLV